MITVAAATELALRAHHGQVDQAGRPYHEHVLAVRDACAEHGPPAQVVAVLHDVLEDTELSADDLRAAGVPDELVTAVESVTRRPGETYLELVGRAAANPLGRVVKLADNLHNSDETRLAALPPEQAARLRDRYAQARAVLSAAD